MKRTLVAALALVLTGCSAEEQANDTADGTWVGTITTEGNVTTVVNESGSVWGGTARLVEEASIGVEAGADEYMFGEVASIYADSAAIYVADRQIPAVRSYDYDGLYLRDFGASGQGPGEYTRPGTIQALPDGSVLVLDDGARRINVYSPNGEARDDVYPLGTGLFCCRVPLLVDPDDTVWVGHIDWDTRGTVYGATYTRRCRVRSPGSYHRIYRLDQRAQPCPWHRLLHLREKPFPAGYLPLLLKGAFGKRLLAHFHLPLAA